MLSISIIPNKNVKWTEMAMVSRCLQLTVIAVFWVMGNSVSISSSEIQCLANSRYQCIQSPCCALSIFCCFNSKSAHTKSKCCTFFPYPFPCRCVSSFTGRTCHYGNQSLWCTDQVNLSSPIAKQSNMESKLSMELPEVMNSSPLFLSGVNQNQAEGYQSCSTRYSRKEIQECPTASPTSVYQSLVTWILPHISANFLSFQF